MADSTPRTPTQTTEEEQTNHKKKAQYVALALVVVIVCGLIASSWLNMSKRANRQTANQDAAERADAAAGEGRSEAKIADFAKAQADAGHKVATQEQATAEEAARKKITDAVTAAQAGGSSNAEGDAASANDGETGTDGTTTVESIERAHLIAERKRVLAAGSSGMGHLSGVTAGGQRGKQPIAQTNQGEIAKITERIDAMSSLPAAIDARKRQLIEAAAASGIALPQSVMQDQSGQAAGVQYQAQRQQSSNGQMNDKAFGELAANRASRDPTNAGPQPGEEILPTASVISAVLDMDMISDYAGNWFAVLQRPVYDPSLEWVLLPAGTKITGKSIRASGVNENIANRMGAVPLYAVRPDGKRIDFRKSAGMDAAGVGALKDQVDRHFLAQFMGVSAYALIGLGPSFGNYGAEPNTSRDAFAREFTTRGREAGRSFAEKFLNIVPTVKILAGTPLKIFIEDDIYIKPWERADAPHYNRR